MNGTRDVAQRISNAETNFVKNAVEGFGITKPQAEKVLRVFIKTKAVRLDAVVGVYRLTHGGLWHTEVIQNAIQNFPD